MDIGIDVPTCMDIDIDIHTYMDFDIVVGTYIDIDIEGNFLIQYFSRVLQKYF
jgi:hypothetical protein